MCGFPLQCSSNLWPRQFRVRKTGRIQYEEVCDFIEPPTASGMPFRLFLIHATIQSLCMYFYGNETKVCRLPKHGIGNKFMVDKISIVLANKNTACKSNTGLSLCKIHSGAEFAGQVKKNGLSHEQKEIIVQYRPIN